jgi:hypothetical protein
VDDLEGQGLGRLHRLAFQQEGGGGHHAHQARQALGAAGARQQADLGFRQGELDLRIVGHHAIVAGQGDFQAAAHGQAVDGRGDRLAAGLQGAEGLVQREAGVEGGLQAGFARPCRPRPPPPSSPRSAPAQKPVVLPEVITAPLMAASVLMRSTTSPISRITEAVRVFIVGRARRR